MSANDKIVDVDKLIEEMQDMRSEVHPYVNQTIDHCIALVKKHSVEMPNIKQLADEIADKIQKQYPKVDYLKTLISQEIVSAFLNEETKPAKDNLCVCGCPESEHEKMLGTCPTAEGVFTPESATNIPVMSDHYETVTKNCANCNLLKWRETSLQSCSLKAPTDTCCDKWVLREKTTEERVIALEARVQAIENITKDYLGRHDNRIAALEAKELSANKK